LHSSPPGGLLATSVPIQETANLLPGHSCCWVLEVICPAPIQLVAQIHERVLELAEQHQLAPRAVGLLHQRVIEDPVQLPPLGIGALIHHLAAQWLQLLERLDLELKLGQGLGGGGVVGEGLLGAFDLAGRVLLVKVVDLGAAQPARLVLGIQLQAALSAAALQQDPLLLQAALQPLTPSLQGAVNRERLLASRRCRVINAKPALIRFLPPPCWLALRSARFISSRT
jgi:hypothetical protein